MIQIKRIYESPNQSDGARILVDRVWPRGVSKEKAQLESWRKELAPSTELRKWFDHEPAQWDEFIQRYQAELANESLSAMLAELAERSRTETITLIYSARDERFNQAHALAITLRDRFDAEVSLADHE